MISAWITLAIAAVTAATCAAADGAVLSLNVTDRMHPALVQLQGRRERAHRALAFARVVSQLAVGFCVAVIFQLGSRSAQEGIVIGLGAGLLMVVISESVARSLGAARGAGTAEALLPFVGAVERVLTPIVWLGGAIDRFLLRLVPSLPPDEEDKEAAAEQFKQVVAVEADVSADQQGLLNGVFRLSQTTVGDLMVPRVDMVAIDRDAPWSEVVDRVRSSEHSRLPVFEGTVDNIIGVLYAKDLVQTVIRDEVPDDWTQMLRAAVFIPDGKSADAQLRDFQTSGTHIAIVADEFGGTAGLLTIEDVLEEIVGEIRDENDEDEGGIEQEAGLRYWVTGRMTLDELSELVRRDMHHDDVTTVAGLIYELLGRVPMAGERMTYAGFQLVVERVVRRRVQRVYFERLDDDAAATRGRIQ